RALHPRARARRGLQEGSVAQRDAGLRPDGEEWRSLRAWGLRCRARRRTRKCVGARRLRKRVHVLLAEARDRLHGDAQQHRNGVLRSDRRRGESALGYLRNSEAGTRDVQTSMQAGLAALKAANIKTTFIPLPDAWHGHMGSEPEVSM